MLPKSTVKTPGLTLDTVLLFDYYLISKTTSYQERNIMQKKKKIFKLHYLPIKFHIDHKVLLMTFKALNALADISR